MFGMKNYVQQIIKKISPYKRIVIGGYLIWELMN